MVTLEAGGVGGDSSKSTREWVWALQKGPELKNSMGQCLVRGRK